MATRRKQDIAPDVARLRSRVGALVIARAPADQVDQARRELASALFESRIEKLLADAPPLSQEQRDRLAALLSGTAGDQTSLGGAV